MTGITGFVLGGLAPDIMRGRQFPGWKTVKFGQTVFYIKLKRVLVNGDMANGDKPFGSFLGTQRIQANLELNLRCLVFIEFKALLICSEMTFIAVIVRLGMANITTHLPLVNPVIFSIFRFRIIDCRMAGQALRAVFNLVTIRIILSVSVHFIRFVTFAAFKVFLFMDIRKKTFILAEILLFYTAPMAGRAHLLHWRFFLE